MKIKIAVAALVVLSFVAPSALAQGSVTVNGVTWTCQNSCSVYTYPNGGTMVKDSRGGWIERSQ